MCWLTDDDYVTEHSTKDCERWIRILGELYKEFQSRNLSYWSNTSCYKCGMPGDECCAYSNRSSCKDENVALPSALVVYADLELGMRKIIYNIAERRFESVVDYSKWMTGGKRSLEQNGTNAFTVFVAIIKEQSI